MTRLQLTSLLLLGLAGAGCFRKEKKGETVLAEAETSIGPRGFALNQPLVPVNGEPVVLSWTPAKDATSYQAGVSPVADCSAPLHQQLGLVSARLAIPSLPEGSYFLCVTAKDDSGRTRRADNDGAAFVVDRTAPTAAVATVPDLIDRKARLVVGGDGVASYSFKAGPSSTTDCGVEGGYSNALPAQDELEFSVISESAMAEEWSLCLLGQDLAGNRQALTGASVYRWQSDGTGRGFSLNLRQAVGEASLVGDNLPLIGTANPHWTTIRDVSVSVEETASGRCLAEGGGAFTASCPNFLAVSGTGTWQLDMAKGAFAEFNRYEVAVRAVDSKTDEIQDAGGGVFHWRFAPEALAGDDDRQVNLSFEAPAGDAIFAGWAKSGLDVGEVKVPRADPAVEASPDWFVAKRNPLGKTIWARRFGGLASDVVRRAVMDKQGAVYLAGTTEGDFTVDAKSFAFKGKVDVLLLKLDGATGALLWAVQIASEFTESVGGLALNADDEPVLLGGECGPVDFGDGTVVTPKYCGMFLATYAGADGALKRLKAFDCNGYVHGEGLELDAAGNAFVVGALGGTLKLGATNLVAPSGKRAGFVAKLDGDAEVVWAKTVISAGEPEFQGVALTDDGHVAVSGTVDHAGASYDGGTAFGADDVQTLVVAMLAADGSLEWLRSAPTTSKDGATYDVVADAAGNAYVTAKVVDGATFDGQAYPTHGKSDLLFARFDKADGHASLIQYFGNDGSDVAGASLLSRAPSGEILFTIGHWSPLYLGNHYYGWSHGHDALLMRYAN